MVAGRVVCVTGLGVESQPLFAGGVPLLIARGISQSAMRGNGGDAGEGVGRPNGEDLLKFVERSEGEGPYLSGE